MRNIKLINWPNFITTIRAVCIPFFIWAFITSQRNLAIALFLAITLGDWIDGFAARKLNQQTYFGKIYDGITDTLFFYSALITLTITGKLSILYLVLLILPRLWTFCKEAYHYQKTKRIAYDTSIYRKAAGWFIFLLIFISLLKQDIHIEALVAIIANYAALIIERLRNARKK